MSSDGSGKLVAALRKKARRIIAALPSPTYSLGVFAVGWFLWFRVRGRNLDKGTGKVVVFERPRVLFRLGHHWDAADCGVRW